MQLTTYLSEKKLENAEFLKKISQNASSIPYNIISTIPLIEIVIKQKKYITYIQVKYVCLKIKWTHHVINKQKIMFVF